MWPKHVISPLLQTHLVDCQAQQKHISSKPIDISQNKLFRTRLNKKISERNVWPKFPWKTLFRSPETFDNSWNTITIKSLLLLCFWLKLYKWTAICLVFDKHLHTMLFYEVSRDMISKVSHNFQKKGIYNTVSAFSFVFSYKDSHH